MLVDKKKNVSAAAVPGLDLYIGHNDKDVPALSWCNARQNERTLLVQPQNSLKEIF